MYTINPDLINDLAERRAAIFVGAGVSAGVTTRAGTRIKLWSQFLSEASLKLDDAKLRKHAQELIKQQDYLMACEMIIRGLGSVDRGLSCRHHGQTVAAGACSARTLPGWRPPGA